MEKAMKNTDKGLIRSNNRKGVRSGKAGAAHQGPSRVLLRGAFVLAHEDEIRRRIANVTDRAALRRPELAHLELERKGEGFEISGPSQEFAHRIVNELGKAFHGEASLKWSDGDGSLLATWVREE